jgi:hypothetical protein
MISLVAIPICSSVVPLEKLPAHFIGSKTLPVSFCTISTHASWSPVHMVTFVFVAGPFIITSTRMVRRGYGTIISLIVLRSRDTIKMFTYVGFVPSSFVVLFVSYRVWGSRGVRYITSMFCIFSSPLSRTSVLIVLPSTVFAGTACTRRAPIIVCCTTLRQYCVFVMCIICARISIGLRVILGCVGVAIGFPAIIPF